MNNKEYFQYLLNARLPLSSLYRNRLLYPRVLRRVSGRLLDYGCGIGDLLALYTNAVGVDINEYCVEYCNSRELEAYHIEADTLPFAAESFGTVILDNVLEHLPEWRPVLAEIFRVLEPGGRLILGVPGKKGYSSDDTHTHFYEEKELTAVCSEAGFRTAEFFYSPLFCSSFLSRHLRIYAVWGVFEKEGP